MHTPGMPLRVVAAVATVWTSPAAPRVVDAAAVADVPDPAAWLATLDAQDRTGGGGEDRLLTGRLGLHGRVDTQAVLGEPVLLVEPGADESPADDGWVQVVLPWQPSRRDPRGYPGWVRRAHLGPDVGGPPEPMPGGIPAGVLDRARTHLGLRYLWGGCSPLGLDCSGLVHTVWRSFGVVVPRDADDQQRVARPVRIGAELPGDLYFFAGPDGSVDHVGIVVEPGRMIDAAEGRGTVAEGPWNAHRRATLHSVGRLSLPEGAAGIALAPGPDSLPG